MTSFDLLLVALTFALGFALLRANLCTVACLRGLILQRHYAGVLGLAVTSSAAGIVLLSFYLLWPAQAMLPIDSSAWAQLALGGTVLGIGSMINGACYLGSITYLGTGNVNYLFTLLGIALGLRLSEGLPAGSHLMTPGSHMQMGREVVVGLSLFACVVGLGIAVGVRKEDIHRALSLRKPWPWPVAAAICGLLAGLVFARHPNWTYGSAIDSLAHADLRPIDWPAALSACALFVGAIVSAHLMQRYRLKNFSTLKILRCLAGGALMAYGASLIPGGNDSLLLWSIPGLARYGLVAYAAMAATICLAAFVERCVRSSTFAAVWSSIKRL